MKGPSRPSPSFRTPISFILWTIASFIFASLFSFGHSESGEKITAITHGEDSLQFVLNLLPPSEIESLWRFHGVVRLARCSEEVPIR